MNSPEHPESHSPSSASGDKPPPGLFFNALPFSYPQEEADISFTTTRKKKLYRFRPAQVPQAVIDNAPPGTQHEWFYSRVSSGGPGFSMPVKLSDYPTLARVWCSRQIRKLLAPHVAYIFPLDACTTEFWCPEQETLPFPPSVATATGNAREWQAYHRFTVRVSHPAGMHHPELLVGYNGLGCILLLNLQDLDDQNFDTRLIGHAAFRGRIYKFKDLPDSARYHSEEVNPLLQGEVLRWRNLEFIDELVHKTPISCYPLIRSFIKTLCLTGLFKAVVPHNGRFRAVAPAGSGRVRAANSQLLFGERGCASGPKEGMTTYGPLKRPGGLHYSCFFIYFEQNQKEATELFSYFVNAKSHLRLGRFMRLTVKCSNNLDIVLSDKGNPEQQVKHRLEDMVFSPEVTYCALFIRPAGSLINGGSMRALHSRIIELLLHRGVLVQQVNACDLKNNFKDPSRILGFDLVARLGGTPWRPAGNGQADPVVGFAVNISSDPLEQDFGAAVFFTPGGLFTGANIFDPADQLAWGGLSMEFFQKWDNGCRKVRRLVIHSERLLKTNELEPLRRMMADVKPGLQVVVTAIRKCCSRDLQAFDNTTADAVPAGGTWVHCGGDHYLLYTAGCRSRITHSPKRVMPLNIRFQFINTPEAGREQLAQELLNQVYCYTLMHPPSSVRNPLPVTLTFPALLARRMHLFHGKALPEFGRSSPWFL